MSRSQRDFALGTTLFPGPTAGNGRRNIDKFNGMVDGWSCKQCGYYCMAQRVGVPGTMNEANGFITQLAVTGGSEPVVSAGGCPFCGTPNSR